MIDEIDEAALRAVQDGECQRFVRVAQERLRGEDRGAGGREDKGEAMSERRYGQWAGNPDGEPEDKAQCVQKVWQFMISGQCSRKRGHGRDGLYCKQHAEEHPAAGKTA